LPQKIPNKTQKIQVKNSEIIITTVSYANIPLDNGEFQKKVILENIGSETGVVYSCALWINDIFQNSENMTETDAYASLNFFSFNLPV